MARTELTEELQRSAHDRGPVDLVIGITGTPDVGALYERAGACLQGLSANAVVAYAGGSEAESGGFARNGVGYASYPMPNTAGSFVFWQDMTAAQRTVLALAREWQARACLVIHSDLGALDPETVKLMAEPVLLGNSDLTMPIYPTRKYEALINKGLLAPFCRALFGRRVRFPLSYDFCASGAMLGKLTESDPGGGGGEPRMLWPSNTVVMNGGQIAQAFVNVHHASQTNGMDLAAVLTELAAALFNEAEAGAAFWQRVRASQPAPRYGNPIAPAEDADPIDCSSLVESFVLGSRNLEEVWRLVLPPATMLELKRMARLDVEHFAMPDALWARIIYDFALAYRMRRLSRSHLLGALTPLYLGWVASYANAVGAATTKEANQRTEDLARAYEEQKPYFVSRWRWPERVG